MDCNDFIQRFSEARDGGLRDPRQLRRIEQHARRCPRCARWVESLELGLGELREAMGIEPSARFRKRLRKRLAAEVSIGDPIVPTNAGLAAALLLAAAVGLLVLQNASTPSMEEPAAVRVAAAAALEDSLELVPRQDSMDVTIPAFTHSTLEFHSSQVPVGTLAVLTR